MVRTQGTSICKVFHRKYGHTRRICYYSKAIRSNSHQICTTVCILNFILGLGTWCSWRAPLLKLSEEKQWISHEVFDRAQVRVYSAEVPPLSLSNKPCPVCVRVKTAHSQPSAAAAAVGFSSGIPHSPKPEAWRRAGPALPFDATPKCNLSPSGAGCRVSCQGPKQESICGLVKAAPPRSSKGGSGSPLKRHLKLLGKIMTTGNGCLNNMRK